MQFQRLGPDLETWIRTDIRHRREIRDNRAHLAEQAELALKRAFHPEEDWMTLPRARVLNEAQSAREAFRAAHIASMQAEQELAEAEAALSET